MTEHGGSSQPYEPVLSRSASRAIAQGLPESVAAAVIEFINGPLIVNPRRVGGELHRELSGMRAARRGTWRIIYRIDDERHEIYVVRIEHRAHIYRPL